MDPSKLLGVLLVLALVSVCFSRPLKKEDKKRLRKQQPKWKSPEIDEFLGGNVSKKGNVYTYVFKYKNKEEDKICEVTYKEKHKKDGMMESTHKWKCTGGKSGTVDPDLVGSDYV